MGLDVVEIVTRCGDVFGTGLANEDMERVQTVGDLYAAISKELGMSPCKTPGHGTGTNRLPQNAFDLNSPVWTLENVWATLVAIFVDQLAVEERKVLPSAHINQDFRLTDDKVRT